MEREKKLIIKEPDYIILNKAKLRAELIEEAIKEVPSVEYRKFGPEIKFEAEFACIVKEILPVKLRPTMLSSALISSNKRTDSIKKP